MKLNLLNNAGKFRIESITLLLIFSLTWLGYGRYMAGVIALAFIFSLIFKYKREIIFADRTLIILLCLFVINNILSSLLSIDKLTSVSLSLLWFLVIFIPMSYSRFSINKENEFFVDYITPFSFFISVIIVLYLLTFFLRNYFTYGLIDQTLKRYTFYNLGKATTPDTIVMLSGIGYGFLVQKHGDKYKWLGFFYLLFCFIGIILTLDRGGFLSLFVIIILLLSHDFKRLIIFLILIALIVSFTFIFKPFERFQHLFSYFYSKKSWSRLFTHTQFATFRGAWEMIKDHWLMGVGTNNFSKFVKQYGTGRPYSYAHNFILQFWAENGLFGMLFGLSIIGLVIYRWLKSWKLYKYKYIALGVGASFIGILIGNLTNSTIWIIKIALPFWLLAGIISAIYFIVKEQEENALPEEIREGES